MQGKGDIADRQGRRFRFRNGTMDFDAGWVLGYSQLGGLAPGEVFECFNAIRNGDPNSWMRTFAAMADHQEAAARRDSTPVPASGRYLAAAVAARAAWHFVDPSTDRAHIVHAQLERCFQASMAASGSTFEPINVPTTVGTLPGYATAPIDRPCRDEADWYVVIGGGDTFREDLYFFGGGRAAAEGYEVLLVDLPGQGATPYSGLHFGEATVLALREILVRLRTNWPAAHIVLTGYSGGGYFTLKALDDPATAQNARVDAVVANTPATDIALLLERAMPAILRRRPDGRLARSLTSLAGRFSPVTQSALTKYRWQFGTDWIGEIIPLAREAGVVVTGNLNLPLLALVGVCEPPEAERQALQVFDELVARQPRSRLVRFERWTGADAHCAVNNLRLAQDTIIAWLDEVMPRPRPQRCNP